MVVVLMMIVVVVMMVLVVVVIFYGDKCIMVKCLSVCLSVTKNDHFLL